MYFLASVHPFLFNITDLYWIRTYITSTCIIIAMQTRLSKVRHVDIKVPSCICTYILLFAIIIVFFNRTVYWVC